MIIRYTFGDYEHEHEVNDHYDLVKERFMDEYSLNKFQAKNLMDDYELLCQLEDRYYDYLKEQYLDEAKQKFKEDMEYNKDVEGYYGASRLYD